MNSVMTDYLTDKIACDLISVSTILAIRQVLDTKCRYSAPREIIVDTMHVKVADYDYKDIDGLKVSNTVKYNIKVR